MSFVDRSLKRDIDGRMEAKWKPSPQAATVVAAPISVVVADIGTRE
jgi:hypothetical protein